ncbi:proteasomal ubiquitin receptor ADRM1-like [Kryptolebias marmoratus]|uniref:proteasomal ubiquitin receptor ADRM1-like n=1 Tax=Kryptolebias marmoratus TaxID=37003 RepID=UPI0018AD092F|nr:proteasomal ubiquitin receptor ADRM1-like [Kryptolebias marmoratus]
MSSGALFPSLVSGSRGSSSKYLVEFRAGKMTLKGNTVTPDKRKGTVYIQQSDDSLIHFCWKDRTTGNVDDEPKTDKDDEYCRKVNEYLNNPPIPGTPGSGGGSGHELSALGGEGGLQNLLGNMSHNQLMQLIGPTGLGGLGLGALAGPGLANLLGSGGPPTSSSSSSSRSQAATASTPSSGGTPRLSSSQVPTTSAPSATSAPSSTSVTTSTPASAQTPVVPASVLSPPPHQPIQLSDLQSILANMNVPPAAAAQGPGVDLASVCTPEMMAPILGNPDVQQRLLPFLPSGESLPQSAEEIQNTLNSPQFHQSMSMFSSALASGQLGPLMSQFGLSAEAVDAANRGDVEAFARAMQGSKGDSKEKKSEDDEDMSLN